MQTEKNVFDPDEVVSDEDETETEDQRIERVHGAILGPLREKYGRKGIAFWELDDEQLFVIRKPSKAQHHKYVNELQKDALDKALLAEQYALSCVVYPTKHEAAKILDEFPVFSLTVNARAQELAGASFRELGKG